MYIRFLAFQAHLAADCRPVQFWHFPVQQREPVPTLPPQCFHRYPSVLDGNHFVSGTLQGLLQKPPGERVVIRYKNPHGRLFAIDASSPGMRLATSLSKSATALLNVAVSPERPNCSKWPAAAAARVAAGCESMPFSVGPCFLVFFLFALATASCSTQRWRGISTLQILINSLNNSRSLSTRVSSSERFKTGSGERSSGCIMIVSFFLVYSLHLALSTTFAAAVLRATYFSSMSSSSCGRIGLDK